MCQLLYSIKQVRRDFASCDLLLLCFAQSSLYGFLYLLSCCSMLLWNGDTCTICMYWQVLNVG